MYVVLARHNTGHGKATDVILCTEDRDLAIRTAENVEDFGYQFYTNQCYVEVVKMEMDRVYSKKEFTTTLGEPPPEDYPIILLMRKDENGWGVWE